MKEFTIKNDEKFDICITLKVFNTRKKMLTAVASYMKKIGEKNDTSPTTCGMFCPTVQITYTDYHGIFHSNVIGAIYLNLEDLNEEVISHESAHAAFAYEHYIRRYTGNFGDDDFTEQEVFCYFVGNTVAQINEVIKKNFKRGKK